MALKETAEFPEQEAQLDELPPGTTLLHGQYRITRFLNNGGFGITYLAKDSLDRDVVIKECFADAFCRRTNTIVSARSRAHQNELKSIIRHFIQEARALARLKHPNIVGVHQVFEDNDTAYMAIDFVDGKDLLDIVEDPRSRLTPEQIVEITRKLLSAIGYVHEHGLLHRDISPDNILVDKRGEPVLIDFGAAREHSTAPGRKHSALRVVKDGYSPQEFYIAGSEQGPWSDLYALAASLYHAIRGEAPVSGQARLAAIAEQRPDPYVPLAGAVPGYPPGFLEAIDKAMSTRPSARLQSAAEWLQMIDDPQPRHTGVDGSPEEAISRLLSESYERAEARAAGLEDAPRKTRKAEMFEPLVEAPAPAADEVSRMAHGRLMARLGMALLAMVAAGGYVLLMRDLGGADRAVPAAEPDHAALAAADPAAGTGAAAAVAAALGAPTAARAPSPMQIVSESWDVDIPFAFAAKTIRNAEAAVITALDEGLDRAATGDWLAVGVEIFAVNDRPLTAAEGLAERIRETLTVDPDGRTRAMVRYRSGPGGAFEQGVLTLPIKRRFGLADGTELTARLAGGAWTYAVTKLGEQPEDGLRPGDIVLRETSGDMALDGIDSLEAALRGLVERGQTETQFEVLRGDRTIRVPYQLG
ncbi:serine/threonine-protein kinase [Albidovulum sp.]